MSIKERLLELPSPAQVNSGSEWRNIVCAVCSRCFEHANSAPHNNYHSCLCPLCRAEIEQCKDDDEVNDVIDRLWKEADDRGEVCAEYSYYAALEEEKLIKEANR